MDGRRDDGNETEASAGQARPTGAQRLNARAQLVRLRLPFLSSPTPRFCCRSLHPFLVSCDIFYQSRRSLQTFLLSRSLPVLLFPLIFPIAHIVIHSKDIGPAWSIRLAIVDRPGSRRRRRPTGVWRIGRNTWRTRSDRAARATVSLVFPMPCLLIELYPGGHVQ